MKNRCGCRMEPFRSLPLREHRRGQGSRRKPLRGEGESPMCHNVARHSYCSTALLHLSHGIAASQWICRASARDAGKANSYIHKAVFSRSLNSAGIGLFISNEIWIIKIKVTMTANILTHFDLIFFHDYFKYSFIPSWLASKPIFS